VRLFADRLRINGRRDGLLQADRKTLEGSDRALAAEEVKVPTNDGGGRLIREPPPLLPFPSSPTERRMSSAGQSYRVLSVAAD
jgi:hypothetical protein